MERSSGWVFYVPIVFMILFFAIPMALTVVFSFFERTMFWMEPGFSLKAYENFFFSARLKNFLSSMYYSLIAVVICFVLGFPIAVFLRRSVPQVAQHRVILLFILPFMVSEIIRIFALRPVLQRNGLINTALENLGIIDEPLTFLIYSHTGVIIGEVLSFLPFIVFAGFLAMEAVPKYIFEVCDDIGAGPFARFRDVILPLAAPGIFAGSVFIFVNGIGVALLPNILGGPGAVNAGLIATQAIAALDFPLAMAISAIMMLTLMGLLYIGHRIFDLTKILAPIN
ncbi:ABC transporter permease [Sulfitobacter sp.]|uniref:ABC transporter permease n=1 Tax=Sulfitobacter sp. TaxID=1903071 RepID=UPI003001139F